MDSEVTFTIYLNKHTKKYGFLFVAVVFRPLLEDRSKFVINFLLNHHHDQLYHFSYSYSYFPINQMACPVKTNLSAILMIEVYLLLFELMNNSYICPV